VAASAAAAAVPGVDARHLAEALADFRRFRRARRLATVHWVDALYQTYLTALIGAVVVLLVSDAIGDSPVVGRSLADFGDTAPAALGVVVALAVAVGLRSGTRGGPLALERQEVRMVLLAPVDRGRAVLSPAVRQVRFALFVGAVVGAVGGHLTSARLPGADLGWSASGAAWGLVTVASAYGAAFLVAGRRPASWVVTLVAVALTGWSVGDLLDRLPPSPTSYIGDIALWPLHVEGWSFVAAAVSIVLLVGGVAGAGGLSLESAERRSILVGQLRFAATLQDIRTVIVLRRQLAMELPRQRPWIRLRPRADGRFPVWTRGWRGVLRWPAARVGRMLLLAVVAGAAARGAWAGTTPLVVLAGLALFVAALDAVEPLGQEVDHPSQRDSFPTPAGLLHLHHVPAVVAVMGCVVVVAAATGVLLAPSVGALAAGAVLVVPATLGASAGGLVSLVSGDSPPSAGTQAALPPEAAGFRLAFRTAWPPLLAVLGVVPLLVARAGYEDGRSAIVGAALAAIPVALVAALVFGWVRVRDDIHAWWKTAVEQAFPGRGHRD
jgi:hypothetical protein